MAVIVTLVLGIFLLILLSWLIVAVTFLRAELHSYEEGRLIEKALRDVASG